MVTQEIGLNEALEAAGVRAWETDLAELIVQLGHDRPSHILVPAIHRNRAEIREIFLRGMADAPADLTDEPRRLAMAARAHLRRKFLTAKVAVSGANFAVAETGSLVVVESEGNGRMCLTLPETLVTVMGIEKLVPTWRDLEVFLQLLPRSSTGERMNPYTSVWTGVTPGDGPQAFHLVLLDNGRTATLADEVGREALHCIKCSACMNVCPVYERTGGHAYGSVYPGPIGAVLSPQLTGIEDNASLPYASSLCGACFDVCPVRIDIPALLVHLRARHVEERRAARRLPTAEAVTMAAASWVMSDSGRFARAEKLGRVGRLAACGSGGASSGGASSGGASGGGLRWLPPPLSAWTGEPGCARPAAGDVPRVVGPNQRRFVVSGAPAHHGTPSSSGGGDARSSMLASIRAAIGSAVVPEPARSYRTGGEHPAGAAAVLDLFEDRLRDYGADVRRSDRAGLKAAVVEALAAAVPAGGSALLPPDLPEEWAPEGSRDDGTLTAADLDTFAAVVTACRAACAETGTIVLDGGAGQGRRALSLVPDVHVCVVSADQVVQTLPELLARLDGTRPLTFVSGPSATSDIELDRVEGVHGPRTLAVVIVD